MPKQSPALRAALAAGQYTALSASIDVTKILADVNELDIQIVGPDGQPIQDGSTRFLLTLFFSSARGGDVPLSSQNLQFDTYTYGGLAAVHNSSTMHVFQTDENGRLKCRVDHTAGALTIYPNVAIGGRIIAGHEAMVYT